METSFQKIIAAVVGVMIMFIIPIYIAFEKVDDVSYSLIVKLTQNFVDNVRNKGYISPEMYTEFVSGLYATNNAYDVEIEHVKKRYDPAIYIYEKVHNDEDGSDTRGNLFYTLDYDRYKEQLNNGEIIVEGMTYKKDNYILEKSHKINEEIVTDKQIVSKLFEGTGVTKIEFLRQCMLGNGDIYNSLVYVNENSYIMNEGDQINVIVKNKNQTVASVFYNMFTANVGNEDISKIYINYGGTIKNSGSTTVTEETGVVNSELGRLFKYQGQAEEVTLAPGKYQIECWGAAGGGNEVGLTNTTGGKGAYVKGEFSITKETTLYVYVGGKGSLYSENNQSNGGYNGGGNSYNGYGGGGATDVRLLKGDYNDTDSLLTRIIVAAGGGGSSKKNVSTGSWGNGGAGGNLSSGFNGLPETSQCEGLGASITTIAQGYNSYQKSATESVPIPETEKGGLGKGGNVDFDGAGAGGSGFFGGSAAHDEYAGGGGGISYIYTNNIVMKSGKKYPYGSYIYENEMLNYTLQDTFYNKFVNANGIWKGIMFVEGTEDIKDGNSDDMRNPLTYIGTDNLTGNHGNGYAVIKTIELY